MYARLYVHAHISHTKTHTHITDLQATGPEIQLSRKAGIQRLCARAAPKRSWRPTVKGDPEPWCPPRAATSQRTLRWMCVYVCSRVCLCVGFWKKMTKVIIESRHVTMYPAMHACEVLYTNAYRRNHVCVYDWYARESSVCVCMCVVINVVFFCMHECRIYIPTYMHLIHFHTTVWCARCMIQTHITWEEAVMG